MGNEIEAIAYFIKKSSSSNVSGNIYTSLGLTPISFQDEINALAWGLEQLDFSKLSSLEQTKHILYAIHYSDDKMVNMDEIFKNFPWSKSFYSRHHTIIFDETLYTVQLSFATPVSLKTGYYNPIINFNEGHVWEGKIFGEDWTGLKSQQYRWGTKSPSFNSLRKWLYDY